MEKNNRDYNKEKFEKLFDNFPSAYKQYLCESIDETNNTRTDEEFNRITESRMSKKEYFIEYMLNNGVMFERIGHWVRANDDNGYWTCSQCGYKVLPVDYYCDPYEAEIKYCEKCGTRML